MEELLMVMQFGTTDHCLSHTKIMKFACTMDILPLLVVLRGRRQKYLLLSLLS